MTEPNKLTHPALPDHAPVAGGIAARARAAAAPQYLAGLNAEQREAVVMHEIEGLTYDEIGVILGVPAGTIKSRLHYAFLALRQRLLGCEEVAS